MQLLARTHCFETLTQYYLRQILSLSTQLHTSQVNVPSKSVLYSSLVSVLPRPQSENWSKLLFLFFLFLSSCLILPLLGWAGAGRVREKGQKRLARLALLVARCVPCRVDPQMVALSWHRLEREDVFLMFLWQEASSLVWCFLVLGILVVQLAATCPYLSSSPLALDAGRMLNLVTVNSIQRAHS